MKTAISVPDAIFRRADRVAKRLGVSRSELYTRALDRYLAEEAALAVRESYDEAFAVSESPAEAEPRRRATRRALLDVEW